MNTDRDWAEAVWELRSYKNDDDRMLTLLAWADWLEEQGDKWRMAPGLRLLANHQFGRGRRPHYCTKVNQYYWSDTGPYQSSLTGEEFRKLAGRLEKSIYGDRKYYETLEQAFIDASWTLSKLDYGQRMAELSE